MSYLDKIIENKKSEVEALKRVVSVEALKDQIAQAPKAIPFAESIRKRNGIIAEFKRASPSKGQIHPKTIHVEEVVPFYEKAGVSAVSILADKVFFKGEENDIPDAAKILNIPILYKEFVIDPLQIFQARAKGASAILLIAACLEKQKLLEFASIANELKLEVLLEMHSEDELEYISKEINVVGINNRNLRTFEVDLKHSISLGKMLPNTLTRISESGIKTIDEMIMMRQEGFNGFLIGENFMRNDNPGKACEAFCGEYKSRL